jgi:site-specific DNA-adenine methylase
VTRTLFDDEAAEDGRKTKALGNWFGSNRTNAPRVGAELKGCTHVVLPTFGGGSELPYIDARQIIVNDLHEHMINLAATMAHPVDGSRVYRALRRISFSTAVLEAARHVCQGRDNRRFVTLSGMEGHTAKSILAAAYFVCIWQGRGGKAGTKGEFKGALPIRWNDGGGSSVVRYQSAIGGALWFRRFLRRCEFSALNVFDVLPKVHNKPRHGVYLDAPWPDAGEEYLHGFTERDQRRLAVELERFTETRVVVRYGDHPLIRELYQRPRWTWIEFDSRDQANQKKPEVLIINGPSYGAAA